MIAVIFEVWPADGHKQTYLDIAARLKIAPPRSMSVAAYATERRPRAANDVPDPHRRIASSPRLLDDLRGLDTIV